MKKITKKFNKWVKIPNEILKTTADMVKRRKDSFKQFQQPQEEFQKIKTTVGSNNKQIIESIKKFGRSINNDQEELSKGIYYDITGREYDRD